MKVSIMYTLQPSVNDGNAWLLMSDSNTNMMRGLMDEMFRQSDWEIDFHILAPAKATCRDYDELLKGIEIPLENVTIWDASELAPVDANMYRYFFSEDNTNILKMWLDNNDADNFVFWNNIPEQTSNYLSYLRHPKGEEYVPDNMYVVNCCYFLDSPLHAKTAPEKQDYKFTSANWWRQVEGALRADIAGFCCDGNMNQFMEGAAHTHTDHIVQSLIKKSHVFRFGYSESELDAAKELGWRELDDNMYANGKRLIVFPNRITRPDYTNFWLFKEAMDILGTMRDDFIWTATNPGQKYVTNAELQDNEDYPNYFMSSSEDLSRREYANLLTHATIHCSLFVEEANGGCACREAMHLRSMPVMPFANEYTRLAKAHYPGYINVTDGKVSAQDIADACSRLLDIEAPFPFDEVSNQYEFNHKMGSFVSSTAVVLDVLDNLFQ